MRNAGNGNANRSFVVRYYLSSDSNITTSDRVLGSLSVNGLTAGASGTRNFGFNLPGSLQSGAPYHIGVRVDATGRINESNENNNTYLIHRFTPGLADLVVSAGSATGVFEPGGVVKVDATILNQGSA